jgi:quinol monooxygenase YgiN
VAVAVIVHRVADYAAWREVYDSVGGMQNEGGVLREEVHQDPNDPNNVLVLHYFADVAAAQAFFEGTELREALERGGVQGAPRVEIFD